MIIGLCGYAGSGKDTAASFLVQELGFIRYAFADKLKEVAYAIDPYVMVGPDRFERLTRIVDCQGWDDAKRNHRDIRRLIQRVGTEAGRNLISDTLWIDLMLRDLNPNRSAVVSDVRFPNEAEALRSVGGVIVKVVRGSQSPMDHPSETEVDSIMSDHLLINNSSESDLHDEIRKLYLLLAKEEFDRKNPT